MVSSRCDVSLCRKHTPAATILVDELECECIFACALWWCGVVSCGCSAKFDKSLNISTNIQLCAIEANAHVRTYEKQTEYFSIYVFENELIGWRLEKMNERYWHKHLVTCIGYSTYKIRYVTQNKQNQLRGFFHFFFEFSFSTRVNSVRNFSISRSNWHMKNASKCKNICWERQLTQIKLIFVFFFTVMLIVVGTTTGYLIFFIIFFYKITHCVRVRPKMWPK